MPKLSDGEIEAALSNLPGWNYEHGEIVREFKFRDFIGALGFITQVGALQEQMDHHATITNTYADVKLALSTHSEGGITDKDLELAQKINERSAGSQ